MHEGLSVRLKPLTVVHCSLHDGLPDHLQGRSEADQLQEDTQLVPAEIPGHMQVGHIKGRTVSRL